MNEKLYIHEFIDIVGHDRARYMHHMTANFSPMAQEDRNQPRPCRTRAWRSGGRPRCRCARAATAACPRRRRGRARSASSPPAACAARSTRTTGSRAIPRWEAWAEHEKARRTDAAQIAWWKDARAFVTATSRILLVDAPLCPFRTGRQPQRSDRTEPWEEQ